MIRGLTAGLAAAVLAATALVGCAAEPAPQRPSGPRAGSNDINPQPRDAVRDGGELRWTLDVMPENLNTGQAGGATADAAEVMGALMPRDHVGTADGGLRVDTDYFTSVQLTSTLPQVVTYTINPRATWSDGTPISWRDLAAQWRARSGADPAFRVAGTTGYEDIASVTQGGAGGTDDRQAVVTFARPFAEWPGLFTLLYPAATNADPVAFNTGWVNRAPVTAGPFAVESIDTTSRTITLRRDPRWWGEPAKLDRIVFKVYDRTALADGLAGNDIDFFAIGSSLELLQRARNTPGVVIRQAPERQYNQITFNGAPGEVLADVRLRRAIAQGIDRRAIAQRMIGQIVPDATSLDNHIYPYGSRDYRGNADALPYDPANAHRELGELGWLRPAPDAPRARSGFPLRLRLVTDQANPVGQQIDRMVVEQLTALGVTIELRPVPAQDKSRVIRGGDFDLIGFGWTGTATPFSAQRALYTEPKGDDVGRNYGRITSPEIVALFDQGIRELDDDRRAEIGNRVDRLIWQQAHHLPLYPSTGAYAVRSTLANFGAPGFADIDYADVGYVK